MREKIREIWNKLYRGHENLLEDFLKFLENSKCDFRPSFEDEKVDWYKDAVIYSLYVDLFSEDIEGLTEKLSYLENLGINCIWLLPILESPMKDGGFDISDYKKIRPSLLGSGDQKIFEIFLAKAHRKNIRVIFDIALNHCSEAHPWFLKSRKDKKNPKRDFFIWSETTEKYEGARIIFKGLCESNWEYDPNTGEYYFHRFFPNQPDLNYRNPEVLVEMSKTLIYWKLKGLDGFRADAIPYIWKEDNTNCENLPQTHMVVKFFRAVLDYIQSGTLLLAEACQPPKKVVEYFGNNDECNAAYHFPVMPRIYRSLAEESNEAVKWVLSPEITPVQIPSECQWLMFLRCHDELTLEMVTPEERRIIFDYYVKDPLWSFREGEGISARLATLFGGNPKKIKLAYSIMFSLIGSPIIFYGDELGKTNDEDYYREQFEKTGIKDSRYLVRGRINWNKIEKELNDMNSFPHNIFSFIRKIIEIKRENSALGRGKLEFIDFKNDTGEEIKEVLAYYRIHEENRLLIVQNLSSKRMCGKIGEKIESKKDLFRSEIKICDEEITLDPYEYHWIKI